MRPEVRNLEDSRRHPDWLSGSCSAVLGAMARAFAHALAARCSLCIWFQPELSPPARPHSASASSPRVPFQVGVDRYLPAAFGKIHPRWKTPFVSILIGLLLYWRGAKARLS
jgi:amino acid transporter